MKRVMVSLPRSNLTLEPRCIWYLYLSLVQLLATSIWTIPQASDITQSPETQPVSLVVEQPQQKSVKEKPPVPDPDGKVKIHKYICIHIAKDNGDCV